MAGEQKFGGLAFSEVIEYWKPGNVDYVGDGLTIEELRDDLAELSTYFASFRDEVNALANKESFDADSTLLSLFSICRKYGVCTT